MNSWRILHGDVRERLRDLPDGSVQTCVTSPPYWGLRDYGVEGQIGLEQTPDAFVAALVEVFREVRRVLADDGTAWVNLGDSYSGSGAGGGGNRKGNEHGQHDALAVVGRPRSDVKPKDLCGIPWRVAFALQADGWYLRSDIIWSKPNPMPESVTDRPTKAHEYIFLLSKSARYYYDAEAVREANTPDMQRRAEAGHTRGANGKIDASRQDALTLRGPDAMAITADGRNKRSVWHIATQPYPEAHFATFPEALIEPCILAGTSEKGCCPKCYKGWVRVVERESSQPTSAPTSHRHVRLAADGANGLAGEHVARGHARPPRNAASTATTTGWQPSCDCQVGDPIPCTVLDPFNGSGTTGAVAIRHGRNYVGIELNQAYIELARKRISAVAPLFASEVA